MKPAAYILKRRMGLIVSILFAAIIFFIGVSIEDAQPTPFLFGLFVAAAGFVVSWPLSLFVRWFVRQFNKTSADFLMSKKSGNRTDEFKSPYL